MGQVVSGSQEVMMAGQAVGDSQKVTMVEYQPGRAQHSLVAEGVHV